jgi:HEAT repeat protein
MLWLTLRQLKSANPETRKRAVERLSESKDRRALDALVAILEDENPGVRKSAELALSRLGEPAVGALESALRLAGPEARVAAASALARIRGVADYVVVLLGDSDPGVRKAASEALSELKWKAPTAAARAQFLVARCDWAQLPALGFAAVAPLLAVIEEQGLRRPATQALRDLRPGHDLGEDMPTAVQQLLGALNHKDGSVRQAAATVLGRAGDRKAAASLAAALCDSDGAVSRAALDALKVLDPRWLNSEGVHQAVAALAVYLSAADTERRKLATDMLSELGHPAAVGPLLSALRDASPPVRDSALAGLARIGDRAAAGAVLTLLREKPKLPLSEAVIQVLALDTETTAGPLTEILNNSPTDVQRVAAAAIGHVGSCSFVPVLVSLLGASPNNDVVSAAVDALKSIRNWKSSAVASSTVPPLLNALGTAVKCDTGSTAAESLLSLLDEIAPDWPESEVAGCAVPSLISMLEGRIGARAASLLGRTRDRRAVIPLIKAQSSSPKNALCIAADTALQEMGTIAFHKVADFLEATLAGKKRQSLERAALWLNQHPSAWGSAEHELVQREKRVVEWAERLLDKASTQVPAEDLQRVAALDHLTIDVHWFECTKDEGSKSGTTTEVVVNVWRLRQLARQELVRRGIPAAQG